MKTYIFTIIINKEITWTVCWEVKKAYYATINYKISVF